MGRWCGTCAFFPCVVWALTGSIAKAEPHWIIGRPTDEIRMTDLTFGAGFDGGYGFGFTPGVMLNIPILDSGFIRSINDSISLEPGFFVSARFAHYDDKKMEDETLVWVIPELGPRWNFHLTPNWDVYGAIKVGWAIGHDDGFWMRAGPGMVWWFARPWALRIDAAGGPRYGGNVFLGLSYQFI